MRPIGLRADMQTMSLVDIVPTPWKNQRGTTQELLAWPATDHWLVRLSVATIDQSGAFSRFDGITRWFTVIDGAGVDLSIGQKQVSLDAGTDPLCFSGDLPCAAKLKGGAVHAFNAMFAPDFEGRVLRVQSGESIELGLAGFVAIYGVQASNCEIAPDEITQNANASVSKVSIKAGDLHWTTDRGELFATESSHLKIHDGHVVVVLGNVLNS